ncbi:MAG TPA: (d)CMP kinase [Solirubrobacteraceae bacterium]|nr:(d)CMP kinase [Solirubrobacteraceae bacterium]
MVIAIDGPAGAGKSTVARAVADALGFTYLDTGAMYRAVALARLRGEERTEIDFADGRVTLNGEDVSGEIRTPEVSEEASRVAAEREVRAAMVERQRELMADGDWVAEGRDIGTVVAPDAEVKVFLTADPRERAQRRALELGVEVERVLEEQRARDERDSTREASPLVRAQGAREVDTTGLTIEEVVERVVGLARGAAA